MKFPGLLCQITLTLVFACSVIAQDRPESSGGKQQPASRPVDAAAPTAHSSLPTIDLPEFVITGTTSVNPPDVQKGFLDEGGTYKRNPLENSPGTRDRETIDLGARFKQSLLTTSEGLYGIAGAGLGTFFSANVFGSFGQSEKSYDFLGDARYRRTRGFMRFTDASGGRLGLKGSLIVRSESHLLDEARVSGEASYGLSKYKFYGSLSPSLGRDWSNVRFGTRAVTSLNAPAVVSAGLIYQALAVHDSSAATTENMVTIDAGGQVPVFDFLLDVKAGLRLTTVTSGSINNLSEASVTIGVPPRSWGNFLFEISATGFAIRGMAGQQSSYLYPHLVARYSGLKNQILFLHFRPQVKYTTLREQIHINPYLSANMVIRHEIHRWAVAGGIESDWSSWLGTRMELRIQSVDDYPLFADSAASGIWALVYGGRTSLAAFRVDAVANITTNDYFALAVTARTAKNSVYGSRVPYLAEFEASVVYRHRFPFDVSAGPALSVLGSRRASAQSAETVGSYLWSGMNVEYNRIPGLSVSLEIRNLFDRRYEEWKGYRAEPFSMVLGLSYRW
ncbi:MAG: TonB-dependent receptor [Ignavibacteriales bacterium]|nr:TonB-dependent receptor [Ignavibacteriales bacterium]